MALAGEDQPAEHPLLPGVRSPEVWDKQWPSAMHDKLLTGFSPLTCGMPTAPRVWATIHPGGLANSGAFLRLANGKTFFLLQDSRLRRVDQDGDVVWEYAASRALFYEQLHGDAVFTLGVQSGNHLVLLDPRTGKPIWQRRFGGTIGPGKVRVGRLLSNHPGRQIVVFPQYVTEGYLFVFRTGQRAPELVWKTEDAAVANWPAPADHGVTTIIEPDGSVIWNIRHHTINSHDPATGRLVRRQEFTSGGGRRRNYGPSLIGQSTDGSPVIAATSQYVEHHLNCFTRTVHPGPSSIFDRFCGYVYDPNTLGSTTRFVTSGMGDVDADGGTDVVYSLRVGGPQPQSKTIVCDLGTGRERVLSDTWLAGLVDLDGDGKREIFVYTDSTAEMPDRGTLQVYQFEANGSLVCIHTEPHAQLMLRPLSPIEQPSEVAWSNVDLNAPAILPEQQGVAALVRDLTTNNIRLLFQCPGRQGLGTRDAGAVFSDGKLIAVGKWTPDGAGHCAVQSSTGRLKMMSFDRELKFELPLTGGGVPLVSAADLTGDGSSELLVRSAQHRLNVYSMDKDGTAQPLWDAPFVGRSSRLSALSRDINGDGRRDVVTMDHTADGRLCVRLRGGDGAVIWNSPLPFPSSGDVVKWVAGEFFGSEHPGIFVSVQQGQTREASCMLDGLNGHIVWEGKTIDTPAGVRACNPVGIPTVFDVDGDRKDDVMLDYRDFVAVHRGYDGAFIRELTSMPTVPAGWKVAYNSFIPLYRNDEQVPHFLVPLGHGGIGVLANDLRTEIWFHKPYYDTPQKVGIIDVDGDGRLEVGYEERRDGWFVCRDVWSGKEEWRLELAGKGYGPVITADIDGDGRGEFLIGSNCLGTNKQGDGEIRWQAPVSAAGWPAIADLDGDGQGEIIMPGGDGLVRVLKGT